MTIRSTLLLVINALLVGACAGSQSTATTQPRTDPPPTRVDAPADSAAPAADAAAVAAAPGPSLAIFSGPLAEGVGVILAENPRATVTLTPEQQGVAPIELRFGERVRYLSDDAGMGNDSGTALIEARGVQGRVPNGAVILEERLKRSPDGQWAVFSAIESCGDACHSSVRLLSARQAPRDLCSEPLCGGPEIGVAWSADHNTLAVGSYDLRVVTLATGAIRTIESMTSPAFSSSGRLFVRGIGDDDGVFEVTDAPAPRRVFGMAGRARSADDAATSNDPAVVFEQDGAVICGAFFRRSQMRYMRVTIEGRPARGTAACAR